MMSHNIRSALVIGAGTMGAGIAEVLAKSSIQTHLFDVSDEAVEAGLERIKTSLAKAMASDKITNDARLAILDRITLTTDQEVAKDVDLVIEAAPEKLELKQKIFKALSENNSTAILASNTSSLSVTAIAESATNPERVIGLHFFNPVPIMPLLEIVKTPSTSNEVIERCEELARDIGKSAILVNDSPGFASSRLGLVLGLEAIRMVESGVASPEDIDRAMELGYRHPMGPLKLTDWVGLDVRLAIAEHLEREVGPQFAVPPLLRKMVEEGKLGRKTNEGFYLWEGKTAKPKK